MKAKITIEMNNAAFTDYPQCELQRILHKLSGDVSGIQVTIGDRIHIADINGNTVGELKVTR